MRQSLNGQWTMTKKGTDIGYLAQVPTTMYQVLYENKVIEDPFWGENDRLYTKLSEDDYKFEKIFEVEDQLLNQSVILLEFLGIDTLATIHINGSFLASTSNMHRTYRFDVKRLVKHGTNVLTLTFDSPMTYIKKEQAKDPLWGVTSTIAGYEHLRKAHHMFGWDWGPQLPDMGIWRDVSLIAYDEGRIEEVDIKQRHEEDQVKLDVNLSVTQVVSDLSVNISMNDESGNLIASSVVDCIEGMAKATLIIDAPNLWWPNGYGAPYLYELTVALKNQGQVIDYDRKFIGLRTLTVHREEDQWGESFDLEINGVRIFAMGADYIPEDALINRPTRAKTQQLIEDCARANYNCLRVWGGGYYPNDDFYDLCDRHGLIIWQDFMFACGVYRLTKKFEDNIKAELIDNIKRLRHHASLGLWCGNNEMEWGFVEWGLPKDERLRMDYLLMYEKLFVDIVADHDPDRFYWPASPSSGGGFDNPNGDDRGDVHYWKVFHENEHYKKFRDHYFRFASEYGMQALPDMKTIRSFAEEKDFNLFSSVMENHNKCTDPINGNVKILSNMTQEFKLPVDFVDQVYISQVFQGETIKCAVEHFRRHRGRCMGSTYWQVNDNYPVASWASIDYYGRWKAMHYMAKRFYKQVLLSAYEEGPIGHIHVTNDRMTDLVCQVVWQIYHVDGAVINQGQVEAKVNPLTAQHIVDVSLGAYQNQDLGLRDNYLAIQLVVDDIVITRETLLFTTHKGFNFPMAAPTFKLVYDNEAYYVLVSSTSYAKSVGIQSKTIDLLFEDNYFDLLPGETRSIKVEELRSNLPMSFEDIESDLYLQCVNSLRY